MGFHPADRMAFVERQPELFRFKPRCPMMIVIFSADIERGRACLRLLRDLRDPGGFHSTRPSAAFHGHVG